MIILLITIYVLSVIGAYKFIQKAHYHEQGKWNVIDPGLGDIIVTFTPILNIFPAFDFLRGAWKADKYRKEETVITFFKPKQK